MSTGTRRASAGRIPGLPGLGSLLAAAALVTGCITAAPAPPELTPLPTSPWGGLYHYSYAPQIVPASPASVPVTVAVVDPVYRLADSTLGQREYRAVARGFATSMGVDLEKILTQKGMTVLGPYPALDEMTYAEKKSAHLTLVPRVFVVADLKYLGVPLKGGGEADPGEAVRAGEYQPGEYFMVKKFEMTITGWLVYELQESMSGEKMWIKRLELDELAIKGLEAFEAVAQMREESTPRLLGPPKVRTVFAGYAPGKMLYDGKADAVANALDEYYSVALDKLVRLVSPEEMEFLKTQTEEIRARKRY